MSNQLPEFIEQLTGRGLFRRSRPQLLTLMKTSLQPAGGGGIGLVGATADTDVDFGVVGSAVSPENTKLWP